MARSARSNRRSSGPAVSRYSQRTLTYDREFGFYWYAWIWKILRPLLTVAISLVVVLGILATGWQYINNHFFMPVDPVDTQVREFTIESGSSIAKIGDELYKQGFIKNKGVFKYMVQFQELTSKIQFGTYPLSSGMAVGEVIDILSQGSATNERVITVIPGWTIDDIAAYLVKQGAIVNDKEFLALVNDAAKFQDVSWTVDDAVKTQTMNRRKYQLEGYLAPDTYRVYVNATPQDIVERLIYQGDTVRDRVFNTTPTFEVTLDENGNQLDSSGNIITEQPPLFESTLTKDQTIILASMIEKEAGKTKDYRKVSAVFHNRLLKGMKLESDASIAYALGVKRLILTSEELNTESPYNSYLNGGLPIGPICNPSEAALTAALYPDIDYVYDNYLYFCATDPKTGDLKFSKTKEEHEAAVAQYRPLWVAHDQTATQ